MSYTYSQVMGLPWQGSSPAPEMGDSSYGYESQRSEASNTSFYNDVPQEYAAKAFQDVNPVLAYGKFSCTKNQIFGTDHLVSL